MTFAIILLGAMGLAFALARWQDTETTAARWRLYALRDELRWEAIDRGPQRVSRELFRELDHGLTGFCAACQSQVISLWMFAAALILMRMKASPQREPGRFFAALSRPENARFQTVYDAAVWQVIRILVWRHLFLIVLVTPTIVGAVGLFAMFRYVARTMLATPPSHISDSHALAS